jgi:hypothetical protein
MNISEVAKEVAKDILQEEKISDFSPYQLLEFYLEELKERVEEMLEFPSKAN